MAAKNLTREQAFAEMAKGRKARPGTWPRGSWITRNSGDGGPFVDESGNALTMVNLDSPAWATGWRLLKDLPPRAELVRELAEAQAKLEAWRETEKDGHAARESLRADLAKAHVEAHDQGYAMLARDTRIKGLEADLATTKANHRDVCAEYEKRLGILTADLAATKAALAEALARPSGCDVGNTPSMHASHVDAALMGLHTALLADDVPEDWRRSYTGQVLQSVRDKMWAADLAQVPRFSVGDRVATAPGFVGVVCNVAYYLRYDDGTDGGPWDEGDLSPTAKPEPAWVDCSAAVAREKHAAGCCVRWGTETRYLQSGSWGSGAEAGAGLKWLALSQDATGWQWQEVGQ